MFLEKQQLEEGRQLEGLRILVADRDPDHRYLLSFILEADRAKVVSVASVDQAIEALSQQPIDIMFVSIRMLKCHTLLAKVKTCALETGKEILAIAVVDTGRSTNYARLLEMGCLTHISAPLDPSEVVSLVATLTQRYH